MGFCIGYAILPWGPSFIVSLAALRGWCFAPLTAIVGYYVFTSVSSLRALAWFLACLVVIVVTYGINQDMQEFLEAVKVDPFLAQRYYNTFYWTEELGTQMRKFSTFVSAAGYGVTLAYCSIIIFALLVEQSESPIERACGILVTCYSIFGMFQTGSRTAFLSVILGVAIVVILKKRSRLAITFMALLVIGAYFAQVESEGAALHRYSEGLKANTILTRNQIPLKLWLQAIVGNPLGYGLGKSGHGVPFFLSSRYSSEDFIPVDGDGGRLMV